VTRSIASRWSLAGDALAIEYRARARALTSSSPPDKSIGDEATDRIHRAVNIGTQPYEEIVVFFLDHPDAVAQSSDE
jgi:hypothetical protein